MKPLVEENDRFLKEKTDSLIYST